MSDTSDNLYKIFTICLLFTVSLLFGADVDNDKIELTVSAPSEKEALSIFFIYLLEKAGTQKFKKHIVNVFPKEFDECVIENDINKSSIKAYCCSYIDAWSSLSRPVNLMQEEKILKFIENIYSRRKEDIYAYLLTRCCLEKSSLL